MSTPVPPRGGFVHPRTQRRQRVIANAALGRKLEEKNQPCGDHSAQGGLSKKKTQSGET